MPAKMSETASGNMSSNTVSLYDLLGLDPSADANAIKHAYRHYAKIYHPDKNTSSNAKAIFEAHSKIIINSCI